MKVSQAKRLKELEKENSRLRNAPTPYNAVKIASDRRGEGRKLPVERAVGGIGQDGAGRRRRTFRTT